MPYMIHHEHLPNGAHNYVVKFGDEIVGETGIRAAAWRFIDKHRAERKKQIEHELREAWADSGVSVPFDQWVRVHTGMYASLCKEFLG